MTPDPTFNVDAVSNGSEPLEAAPFVNSAGNLSKSQAATTEESTDLLHFRDTERFSRNSNTRCWDAHLRAFVWAVHMARKIFDPLHGAIQDPILNGIGTNKVDNSQFCAGTNRVH